MALPKRKSWSLRPTGCSIGGSGLFLARHRSGSRTAACGLSSILPLREAVGGAFARSRRHREASLVALLSGLTIALMSFGGQFTLAVTRPGPGVRSPVLPRHTTLSMLRQLPGTAVHVRIHLCRSACAGCWYWRRRQRPSILPSVLRL